MKLRHLLILSGLLTVGQSAAEDWKELPKKTVPLAPIAEDIKVSSEVLEASITRGVDHLLETQNASGSWGSATRTKRLNIYAPLPGAHHGYRMATTSLALSGLIASGDTRPEVTAAIEKCEQWMFKKLPLLKRAEQTSIYNNWGHAYGLRALVALAKRPGVTPEKLEQYKKLAKSQVHALKLYQDLDGGWGYLSLSSLTTARPNEGSMSFTTATVLLALKEAQDTFAVSLGNERIKKAVKSIWRQRTPDFVYLYATGHKMYPRYALNRPAGSLARSPACHSATRVWGDTAITDERLVESLDRLVKRNGWLDIGRKRPKPHETHFSISGYFYFYGHYYASEAITLLPATEQEEWKHKLAHLTIDKQEKNGCWWDYPLYNYHYAYGTGYALVTLSRCRIE